MISTTKKPFSLESRDVWVIGGAGYLGREVVQLIVNLGATVLCADLDQKAAEAEFPPEVTPASLDASNIPAIEAFVTSQLATRGVPHAIVFMQFTSTGRRFEDLSTSEFDRTNHLNLTATFAFARAVGDAMAARGGGSIVLFASMYGTVAPDPSIYGEPMNPNPIEYGVAKAGVQQMARYLAVHYGKSGVRCNSISPGPFPNPALQRDHPSFIDRLSKKVPLGRVGQAPEIAGSVAYLVSDASTFVTGHNLAVDGGWTAW